MTGKMPVLLKVIATGDAIGRRSAQWPPTLELRHLASENGCSGYRASSAFGHGGR